MELESFLYIVAFLLVVGLLYGSAADANEKDDRLAIIFVKIEIANLEIDILQHCKRRNRMSRVCREKRKRLEILKAGLEMSTRVVFETRCPTGYSFLSCGASDACVPHKAVTTCDDNGGVVVILGAIPNANP